MSATFCRYFYCPVFSGFPGMLALNTEAREKCQKLAHHPKNPPIRMWQGQRSHRDIASCSHFQVYHVGVKLLADFREQTN